MDNSHKDPEVIDLNVPRHAQYLHNAWKRHQAAVYWVDINLSIEKGLQFYRTRSNAIIFQETLPAFCIPKVVRLKTGEVLYEKSYMSPRPLPKILFKHEWKENWVQNMLNHQKSGTYLEVSNRTNQFQIQFVKDRDDLITCNMEETRTFLRRFMSILFAKNSVLQKERGDLLRQM